VSVRRLTSARSALALGAGLAGLVVLLDQLTKLWALGALDDPPRVIELLGFLDLVLVWNRGVSFGLFGSGDAGVWPFVALAVVISIGLAVWLARLRRVLMVLAVGLILGGALGNVVDRLVYGAVIDFVDLHAGSWHWPAFNLADAAITVGVVVLAVDALLKPWKRHR
jgi:signal peptidase II